MSAAQELPEVVSEGTVKLGDLEVRVLHLSNGERVIEEQSFHALLFAIFGPDESETTSASGSACLSRN